uniref:Uncharacterized protein n=1 Tax=Acrobeloides nanus TaxID=290746 RepID=A0A914EB40_9BILA
MLGNVNIPNDEPFEFYAVPERYLGLPEGMNEPSPYYGSTEESNSIPSKRTSPLNLFNKRGARQIKYLQDGRKVLNGELVENTPPPKHWEQLIFRTFVHKIEDEIESPIDQFSAIQSTFSLLTADQKPRSHSTFSLVSQDLVVSRCEKCCPNQKIAETLSRIATDVGVNSPTKSLSCSNNKARKHLNSESKATKSNLLSQLKSHFGLIQGWKALGIFIS